MVLPTPTKDEKVPRPRALIMVAGRDRGLATLAWRGAVDCWRNRSGAQPLLRSVF
jgi:hypothetical protein